MLSPEQKKLAEDNMPLVYYMANKLGFRDEDSIQFGMWGLCKAAERYDPSKGVEFCTYACSMIAHWFKGDSSHYNHFNRVREGKIVNIESEESYIDNRADYRREVAEDIDYIMSMASPKLRQVFELMLQGYERKEIAEMIGKSVSTIGCWISDFKEEIRNARKYD